MIKRGFTIVELLVVIVILSTFALLGSFGYNKLKDHQANEKARTNAEGIASALDEIYIAGVTTDGARGNKGQYGSLQEACVENGAIIGQIVQKQKGVDKDTKVAYLSAANAERFSQDLSGCGVLPSGEISNSCAGGSPYPAKLVTCDAARETLNANDKANIGTIIYQPITNVKASASHVDTTNLSWQCLGKGFVVASSSSGATGSSLITDEVDCRGFYIYYLEKVGNSVKLSKALTGKY